MKYYFFYALFVCIIPVSALAKAGMPQLEISSYSSQIFWLVISFFFLYFIMSNIVLPRIGEVLKHRRDKITSDLDKAESLNKEASLALESFKEEIEKTKIHTENLIRQSNIDMAAEVASELESAKKDINLDTEKSEAKINEEKDKILDSMYDHCIPIVENIVKQVSGKTVSKKKILEALESLQQNKEA